jgi:hypothetical protein
MISEPVVDEDVAGELIQYVLDEWGDDAEAP